MKPAFMSSITPNNKSGFSCSSALIAVFAVLNVLYLRWATKDKQRRRAELLEPYSGVEDKNGNNNNERAWTELGDRHPDFVYAL